ncbi:MAG: hypothetical protein ACPLRW_04880 [Moorellales bacterium]
MSTVAKFLDDLNEELVQRAETIVCALGQQQGRMEELGKSQLSRAIDVARSAGSVRVLRNWLAYQAAREQSRAFWAQSAGETLLIDHVKKTLAFIEERTNQSFSSDAEARRAAATEAAVRFLGFLRRAFMARELILRWEGSG